MASKIIKFHRELANKADRHDIAEILLIVALNTITTTTNEVKYESDFFK
jgi:hypothetical protein